jgi:hypothetical protein
MEENIKDIGKMVNNTEMDIFNLMKEKDGNKAIGVKEKELNGLFLFIMIKKLFIFPIKYLNLDIYHR